jgi:hypothetical protein
VEAYYFSTHGCRRVFSFVAGAFEELPFVAAAFLCALLPKNASMVVVASKYFQLNGWNIGLGTGV